MNILITGGNGFVGGFIADHLSREHVIYIPRSRDLDLRNVEAVNHWFDAHDVDYVVHSALSGREVLSSTDPQYLSDGLLMFRNLWLNRHRFKGLINLGSAYEMDLNRNNWLVHEHEFLNHLPTTSYGYSKNVIARIIYETENFYNLRIFGNFHETESSKRFFKRVISEPEITIHNDVYMDYVYMADILPMIDLVLTDVVQERNINLVYHLKYRLSELANMLCDAVGIKKTINVVQKGTNNLTGDHSLFAAYDLPLLGLEQGMRNYK